MNRLRILLLVGYLLLALVGGVVYVQSTSNMVLYTEAQLLLPDSVHIASLQIPRFTGLNDDYILNCTFRFENPSKVAITIEQFEFTLAINDSLIGGSLFDPVRLARETVGSAGFGLGNLGPRVEAGHNWTTSVLIHPERTSAKEALNHTDHGYYVVKIFDLKISYRFPGSSLADMTVYPPWIVEAVLPVG